MTGCCGRCGDGRTESHTTATSPVRQLSTSLSSPPPTPRDTSTVFTSHYTEHHTFARVPEVNVNHAEKQEIETEVKSVKNVSNHYSQVEDLYSILFNRVVVETYDLRGGRQEVEMYIQQW